MLVQAGALALLVAGGGAFAPALAAAVLLGVGHGARLPDADRRGLRRRRSRSTARPAVGVYRFWRDFGFVAGALISGFVADALGAGGAIALVAALTGAAASGWPRHAGRHIRGYRQNRWPTSATTPRP